MHMDTIFISINAADHAAQTAWWTKLLGRTFDRIPVPSCREWDLREGVLFQVLDNSSERTRVAVSLRVADLDANIERLRAAGVAVGNPQPVEGFATLRFVSVRDPEGNTLGLLDGA
jgi:predicted enzyme related to lactoylglutathione lyase